jgi:type II secretory pathway pseudopilin PulG
MKGVAKASGFTIVETMIVLAVTGLLFLSAATLISGKEAAVQFSSAIQNVQSQLQETINEVQSGYYASSITNLNCGVSGNTFVISNSGNGRGTNGQCLFLGKALQFGTASLSATQILNIYTIVGARIDPSTASEATSLAAANPTVIASGYSLETVDMHYGLHAAWTSFDNGSHDIPTNDALVFLSSFGNSVGGSLLSGSQTVDSYLIPNDSMASQHSLVTDLAALTPDPTDGIQICLNSGTTKQSGELNIGGSSGMDNVALQLFSSPGCV